MTDTITDLIRHGEPVGGRRYRGHKIDDPLSEAGWSQMWNAVGVYNSWQRVITSPLQRCQAFAQALGKKHNIHVSIEKHFKEVGFGAWEGLTHDEVKNNRADDYLAFLKDPINHRPPGAERLDDFIQRVVSAYLATIERYRHQHCLIVTHAGVIRALIAYTVQAAPTGLYRIKIVNGGITRLRHTETHSILEFLNGKLPAR